ncbi:outer dense fiber protein 3-like [Ylistrum balloti]|uniref:outer dense fiber protein 3-like n=1 Tax=Ylistrum balloti TaxID=509963 RepID=UPI002905C0F4|nr:outer dense fiber protein 3-like [Ylistrum balloti]
MVYNYTRPRAPIAAMYNSPGPCYGLPGMTGRRDHDPRSGHLKAASFSFGIRHGKMKEDSSPGPCYFLTKYYRDGKDGTPQYSVYSRQREPAIFNGPGPGSYSPQNAGPQARFRAASYSFGVRHRNRRTDDVPAPNRYSLPSMTGKTIQSGKKQAPIYSMNARQSRGHFSEDLANAPGPGTYNTTTPSTYKERAPIYSMTARNAMPGDSTQKPGPGAHSPEVVKINKRAPPNFSFGIQHSRYIAPLIVEAD